MIVGSPSVEVGYWYSISMWMRLMMVFEAFTTCPPFTDTRQLHPHPTTPTTAHGFRNFRQSVITPKKKFDSRLHRFFRPVCPVCLLRGWVSHVVGSAHCNIMDNSFVTALSRRFVPVSLWKDPRRLAVCTSWVGYCS